MAEPWFDPNLYAWIPGTVYGVTCGLLGGLAGMLAPQGKARTLIVGSFYTMLVIAVVFLTASVIAFVSGQPDVIGYGFGLPGLLGAILILPMLPVILQRYRQAEDRAMQAKDME